jgi:hypothetical protein
MPASPHHDERISGRSITSQLSKAPPTSPTLVISGAPDATSRRSRSAVAIASASGSAPMARDASRSARSVVRAAPVATSGSNAHRERHVHRRAPGRPAGGVHAVVRAGASAASASLSEIRMAATIPPANASAAASSIPARNASTEAVCSSAVLGRSASGCTNECGA